MATTRAEDEAEEKKRPAEEASNKAGPEAVNIHAFGTRATI